MKAKIKSPGVEMTITGKDIEEMLSRFLYYAKTTAEPLGKTIEIKIKSKTIEIKIKAKTKTQLKKHGIYGK